MKYIGFDLGDGESAVAAFERGSSIEPVILPVAGVKSLLSAVGIKNGEIIVGEQAYTDALAEGLSVRFKSRFTNDLSSHQDVDHFAKGVLQQLASNGLFSAEDHFAIGCPAGWNTSCRIRYRALLEKAGIPNPTIISESRAAFLYAKYAHTVALDIDILNDCALVVDIGSSTLDYAYIVDGRETGIGTFGETALGGGLLDAALLRMAVAQSSQKEEIEAVFRESRPWQSYCEIEARRIKEEYFTRLASETAPSVRKTIRVCYDGLQKLHLEMNPEIANLLTSEPLPELFGLSFTEAIRQSLQNAAQLTADRPPKLVLLTGGASCMPFFRNLCREIFASAVVVSCPEPEFSIAKGLAYAGWVDDNLRAFREAIETELTDERIASVADEAIVQLLPAVAELLTNLIIEEGVLPLIQQWKTGGLATLKQLEEQLSARVERVLSSSMAQEALAPAVTVWTDQLAEKLQALINPICDRFEVPRKQMALKLSAAGKAKVDLNAAGMLGLPVVGAAVSLVAGVFSGLICGGGGMALLAAGPLGFLAGAVLGAAASLLGWNVFSGALMKADLPLVLRALPLEKRIAGDQTRRELKKRLLNAISPSDSPFRRQLTEGFARAFHSHIQTVAQSAEIPIE